MRNYRRGARCRTHYCLRLLCSEFKSMDYWTLILALSAAVAVLIQR